MQLARVTVASPLSATAGLPAIPKGGTSAAAALPPEMLGARIGKGTVRSEIDRAIRVRIEGTGPVSTRDIIADSKAASALMASPNGDKFVTAVRSFLTVGDAHQGKENLKTVTFLPDEHASKGISVLNWADSLARDGKMTASDVIEPSKAHLDDVQKKFPQFTREQVRGELRGLTAVEGVKQLTAGEAGNISFAGAWNSDGHIVMMPDVSREMLATLGLYRIQPGDGLTKAPVERRDERARWTWHAAIHEAHHSITPMGKRGPEWTSVMEEAVPEVLTPSGIQPTMQAAGADPRLAARPARDTKGEAVDWPAWSRDHLPKPPAEQEATAKGRYTDGPELVRDLLRMAGIDRRTTEGKATALELLQGQTASRVPRRIADAIVAAKGLDAAAAPDLAQLIRKASIGKATLAEIERLVAGGS
ncbi:MAG: hypothetical protein JWM86_1262 [Thermoleophilia bacterium]|nr:hypothetical protein [Thermoleophilia bacterium]